MVQTNQSNFHINGSLESKNWIISKFSNVLVLLKNLLNEKNGFWIVGIDLVKLKNMKNEFQIRSVPFLYT